ncbi:MAG: AIR synthase-related protein [Solirubrobacteraceae bacterium]
MSVGEKADGRDSAYGQAGVDYGTLDAGKRAAVAAALATSPLLAARGGRALDASRGEPAFVFEHGGSTLALVVEGLGTKSVIARHVQEQLGVDRFAQVAYDTVAAIVNDLCCVGALPLVAAAYFATGSSDWYAREGRLASLLAGWRRACEDAGCTWGGGESPTLPGLLAQEELELAGSAVGVVPEGVAPLLGDRLAPGDEIVLVASSGLHANGASLARLLAGRLPDGYVTPLGDGTSFGEALLAPSIIYVPLVAALLESRLPVTYLSHITGHGLLKLMRPRRELTYRISALPPVPPVLEFLAGESGMDAVEASCTLNMGAGYAVYCAARAGARVVSLARQLGFEALVAGTVEEGPRRVLLEPLGVELAGDRLDLA